MKTFFRFLTLAFFFLTCGGYAQIEKVIVETYYISDGFDSTDTDGGKLDTGSFTYRVYVDLKPGDRLLSIYGDTNHILKFSSTRPFFNNIDGETYGKDLKKGKYGGSTVALDTWLTLGQTAAKTPDGKANFGILKAQDTNGSFIGGANNDGGTAAIPGGLLTNSISAMGIPLTVADGMFAATLPSYTWTTFGLKDLLSGNDSTMFGSLKPSSEFSSRKAFLRNSPGVTGVIPDSNQVLIAQLTTRGGLQFELNLEVWVSALGDTVRYVANDDTLVAAKSEKKNSFLTYPFPKPVCGCKDPAYLEYNPNLECASTDSCLTLIVFGCADTMACNFDPRVNFPVKSLCCYPGSCGGRDISVVCPAINGNAFECDLYPNPVQGSLFLNVTSGVEQPVTYSVFNYFGTLVLHKDLGMKQRIIQHEIDLSEFSSGIYLVKVNVGSGFVNKQVIKN